MAPGRRLTGVGLAAAAAERSGAAGADSLGSCGGRDKQDVECSEAQRRSTELLKLVGHKKKVLTQIGQHEGS